MFAETPLGAEYHDERHFYDAAHHGLLWVALNELLHAIVLVYSLFGMIRFEVKFIAVHERAKRLIRRTSYLIIAHSWYIVVKFVLICLLIYALMYHLESYHMQLAQFNCNLGAQNVTLRPYNSSRPADNNSNNNSTAISDIEEDPRHVNRVFLRFAFIKSLPWDQLHLGPARFRRLLQLVHEYGGSHKLLGFRACIMFGFYAVAFYTMLAIFPLELFYQNIGFNYIRFVLNDLTCLGELYENRNKHLGHLDRLVGADSDFGYLQPLPGDPQPLPLAPKRHLAASAANRLHPNFASFFAGLKAQREPHQLMRLALLRPRQSRHQLERPHLGGAGRYLRLSHQRAPASLRAVAAASDGRRFWLGGADQAKKWSQLGQQSGQSAAAFSSAEAAVSRLGNQGEGEGKDKGKRQWLRRSQEHWRNVEVARVNLGKFVPHVRSEYWFKASMCIYPLFIFYYFILLTTMTGAISAFMARMVYETRELCLRHYGRDVFREWSFIMDTLTFYESWYAVFALSCASSFFCSFYFGTCLEIIVWILELQQQVELCMSNIQMDAQLLGPQAASGASANTSYHQQLVLNKEFSGLHEEINEFGGIASIWRHLKVNIMISQSKHQRRLQAQAGRLMDKRETLFRATHINLGLFLDEMAATRHLSEKILARTTQITMSFAIMVAVTNSQFQIGVIHMSVLLAVVLLILNSYLFSAAYVNYRINKLARTLEQLVGLLMHHRRTDLLNMYRIHQGELGIQADSLAYVMYGKQITWKNIMSFNSQVTSAYLFTIR